MDKIAAIGIDFGTIKSYVGICNDTEEVRADKYYNYSVSSMSNRVNFTDDGLLHEGGVKEPGCVLETKRIIGRTLRNCRVERDVELWPFKVKCHRNNKEIEVQFRDGTKYYYPEEISASVLKKIKKMADAYVEKTIAKVVISVPPSFTHSQRCATLHAGSLAGLKNVTLINETTSAALCYCIEKNFEAEDNVFMLDFGAGSCDSCIFSIKNRTLTIKTTHGDSQLGGIDFDYILVENAKELFKKKHKKDLEDQAALWKLRGYCERMKIKLSREDVVSFEITNLCEGIDFKMTMSRTEFVNKCGHLFGRVKGIALSCLRISNMSYKNISNVILIGGSSHIPRVQELVREVLKKDHNQLINSDKAVVYGAALQAAKLLGKNVPTFSINEVATYALFLKTEDGKSKLFSQFNRIPSKKVIELPRGKRDLDFTILERHKKNDTNEDISVGTFQFNKGELSLTSGNIDLVAKLNESGIFELFGADREHKFSNSIVIVTVENLKDTQKTNPEIFRTEVEKLEGHVEKMGLKIEQEKVKDTKTDSDKTIEMMDQKQLENKEEFEHKQKQLEKIPGSSLQISVSEGISEELLDLMSNLELKMQELPEVSEYREMLEIRSRDLEEEKRKNSEMAEKEQIISDLENRLKEAESWNSEQVRVITTLQEKVEKLEEDLKASIVQRGRFERYMVDYFKNLLDS